MNSDSQQFDRIMKRLTAIHNRMTQIADIEGKAAWVNGIGARGEFFPEKKALIEETDALLDKWEQLKPEQQ